MLNRLDVAVPPRVSTFADGDSEACDLLACANQAKCVRNETSDLLMCQ